MKKTFLSLVFLAVAHLFLAQKETNITADLKKATVFFTGAQLFHEEKISLQPGKQSIVFQKLTDFIDPNTVQVKALGDLTILSVRTRKNYEDQKISSEEVKTLNAKRKELEIKDENLRDEYAVLEFDKNLLMRNRDLKGQEQGLKITELKEAYAFMHQKLNEITVRQSDIFKELEAIQKKMNQLEQEIISQRSKPVINYSEIIVEVDVEKATSATLFCNYITPRATWKPYYDMRSDGIGKPVRLEAKANVTQTTGQDWKSVDLVLSTNDPYQNAQEPTLNPWYIYYNNYPKQQQQTQRALPSVSFDGEKLRGEIIDASTGEPLPFAKISFYNNPNVSTVSDFDGKFELTVPKGETWVKASFVGYEEAALQITAPYLKFFLRPQDVQLDVVNYEGTKNLGGAAYQWADGDASGETFVDGYYSVNEQTIQALPTSGKKKGKMLFDQRAQSVTTGWNYNQPVTIVQKKDMRVEYSITSKMSIPSDEMEHRVNIANFDLNASYEYHAVPKIDPSVYLAAQVSGWEKLNLMSGESNIYFDGTFMGKSYLDVNSTKDTLSFSFGKDNKISIERKRVKEKSKTKTIGSRQKFEVTWEVKVKNNGGANIPLIIKDQIPVSNNEDIKVKHGDIIGATLDDKTGIITWSFLKGLTGTQTFTFDYNVDFSNGMTLYLE